MENIEIKLNQMLELVKGQTDLEYKILDIKKDIYYIKKDYLEVKNERDEIENEMGYFIKANKERIKLQIINNKLVTTIDDLEKIIDEKEDEIAVLKEKLDINEKQKSWLYKMCFVLCGGR